MNRSHPARGAWIEISFSRRVSQHFPGRTPHGVRGLKWFTSCMLIDLTAGRTPHGVRGLKFLRAAAQLHMMQSHPARGAWIEILVLCYFVG